MKRLPCHPAWCGYGRPCLSASLVHITLPLRHLKSEPYSDVGVPFAPEPHEGAPPLLRAGLLPCRRYLAQPVVADVSTLAAAVNVSLKQGLPVPFTSSDSVVA